MECMTDLMGLDTFPKVIYGQRRSRATPYGPNNIEEFINLLSLS